MRRLQTKAARAALARAERAARQAGIPALMAEVENASRVLNTPAARLIASGKERPLLLQDVEALLASKALVVDACRNVVRDARAVVSLVTRPVLFALARALAEAWPGDVPREQLLARAFGARFVDESHRMRLRVEIGRLRKMLRPLADVSATKRGFVLGASVARARWSCWRSPSKMRMALFSLSSPTASRGRVQPWRLRLGQASVRCRERSIHSRPQERCSRSAAPGLAVG